MLKLSFIYSEAPSPFHRLQQYVCDKLAASGTLSRLHFALGGGIVHVRSYL